MRGGLCRVALLLWFAWVGEVVAESSGPGRDGVLPPAVYVSVGGNDDASGSASEPVATLERATALLPAGGVIHLRKGIYRERVTLEGPEEAPPIEIKAAEGVIFEGGEILTGWERIDGALYAVKLPDTVQETRSNLHLWDRKRLVRMTRLMDEVSVRAFPDTFCLREDGRIVLHFSGDGEPEGIMCNRMSKGMIIQRPHVTVSGVSFRNYFFDRYSTALAIGETGKVKVERCRFENVSKAIAIAALAEGITIERCEIRFAGTAINNRGNGVVIRNSLFEGATGRFAIADLLSVLNCAIRVYHPARGVTIQGNVSAGFTYGLRIKTQGKASEQEVPFIIERNTFLDRVNFTPSVQAGFGEGDRFNGNILLADAENAPLVEVLRERGAAVEGNYLYPEQEGAAPSGSNQNGPPPFADIANGDLKPILDLPQDASGRVAGAGVERVDWKSPSLFAPEEKSPVVQASRFAPPNRKDGRATTLHVRAGADPAQADGSAAKPYPVLQAALDHVLPGDTVLLSEGVHAMDGETVLLRGGTREAPVTLRGAGGPLKSILEGARRAPTLLFLNGVKHVRVEGLQFRWYQEAGLKLEGCESVAIEGCYFMNGELGTRSSAVGNGVYAERSPRTTLKGNLVTRNRVGIKLVASPRAVLENNTGFRNLNTALEMVRSCRNSVIRRNSFGFSSHAAIYLREPDAAALRSLKCDENSYAQRLYDYRVYQEGRTREVEPIAVPPRYGSVAGGKAVIDLLDVAVYVPGSLKRYHQLDAWRKASGKDRDSVFADPAYADPVKGDFRLLPSSPNLRADGSFIGAFGPVSPKGQARAQGSVDEAL